MSAYDSTGIPIRFWTAPLGDLRRRRDKCHEAIKRYSDQTNACIRIWMDDPDFTYGTRFQAYRTRLEYLSARRQALEERAAQLHSVIYERGK